MSSVNQNKTTEMGLEYAALPDQLWFSPRDVDHPGSDVGGTGEEDFPVNDNRVGCIHTVARSPGIGLDDISVTDVHTIDRPSPDFPALNKNRSPPPSLRQSRKDVPLC